ncbi:MAG: hypothetical protein NTZ04_01400 [Chloroflexi bacterium]|nr:hypothetical protein [Chloroflexota bacterium]
MAQVMSWLNMMTGLILFFAMSGISQDWVMFSNPQAKIFPFVLAILLLVNAVYLALARGEFWARRR